MQKCNRNSAWDRTLQNAFKMTQMNTTHDETTDASKIILNELENATKRKIIQIVKLKLDCYP